MLVNAHDHLEFYTDVESGLKTIADYKIYTLANSTTFAEYVALTKKYSKNEFIKIGFGVHPWKVEADTNIEGFEAHIANCDFLGEIGLDFFWDTRKHMYDTQRKIFDHFLHFAEKYNKITNIHSKDAEKEVLQNLKKYDLRTPIIHWYSGPPEFVQEYLDLGCYFTIGPDAGVSQRTDELLAILPIDRILTETDGATSVEWATSHYAEGDYVLNIIDYISEKKRISFDALKKQIFQNYLQLKIT